MAVFKNTILAVLLLALNNNVGAFVPVAPRVSLWKTSSTCSFCRSVEDGEGSRRVVRGVAHLSWNLRLGTTKKCGRTDDNRI